MAEKRSFPTDPLTGEQIRDLRQPGYYGEFSTLDQQGKWEDATRNIVIDRLTNLPAISLLPGWGGGTATSHHRQSNTAGGTVGKYLMAQAGNVVAGRFTEFIRLYKAPPAHALSEEFYETDKRHDFARGFAIQTVGRIHRL